MVSHIDRADSPCGRTEASRYCRALTGGRRTQGQSSDCIRAIGVRMRKFIRRWTDGYYRNRTLLSWTRDHICNMRCNKMVSRNRLGPDGLRQVSASIPDQFKTPDGQTEALALATGILRVFLGSEWVERHVISDNSKNGFL